MRRLATQAGFTLVEVLVAWSVLLVAIVGTLAAFAGSQKGTAKAEERARMVVIAQGELERLRALPYAQVGMARLPGAGGEAPRTGASADEALVEGGVVDPGPTPFDSEGIRGRIYRYVTWRPQTCALLQEKVAARIDARTGAPAGSAKDAVGDLCPGDRHTKRIVVAVVADDPYDPDRVLVPLRAQTVVADTVSPGMQTPVGLSIDRGQQGSEGATAPERIYAGSANQSLYLYDTPCAEASRKPPSDHPTRDTGRAEGNCITPDNTPDMLGTLPPLDVERANASQDLLRPKAEGLALKRDTRAGSCTEHVPYHASESNPRRFSVHSWSTRPLNREVETLAEGGRATLALHTRTVAGAAGYGRLCVVLRRPSDGSLLGSADLRLGQWPRTTTELAVGFELAHVVLRQGERIELIIRNHPDSANDLEVIYDREDAPTALTLTMAEGRLFP